MKVPKEIKQVLTVEVNNDQLNDIIRPLIEEINELRHRVSCLEAVCFDDGR